jgi:ribosomal protein S18 acetylase RimI-like enzyme
VFVDLTLVPEQQRGGIGTRVMREILAEADVRNLPVRVTVERTNAPSLAFCARFGFDVVAEDAVYVALLRPVSPDLPRRASG